jgi:large subunit ribosomal protein L30
VLRITLKKSLIGFPEVQRRTAAALGLGKVSKTVLRPDNGAIRGMVFKLRHVVECETVPDEPVAAAAAEVTK